MNTCAKGKRGEECAARYLEAHGFTIVEKNYRGYRGEIDIVALEEDTVVFVEVKTWDCFDVGELEYVVNREKRNRIEATARQYLFEHNGLRRHAARFDVLFLSTKNGVEEHWRGAFNGA